MVYSSCNTACVCGGGVGGGGIQVSLGFPRDNYPSPPVKLPKCCVVTLLKTNFHRQSKSFKEDLLYYIMLYYIILY
jgi:hypothetical protein